MGETIKVTVLECPNCGAGISKGSRKCPRCYSDYLVTINKFDDSGLKAYLNKCRQAAVSGSVDGSSVEVHMAMGLCQLRRKLYPYANACFEKAISLCPEDGDVFFYAAISLLEGKKAFLAQRTAINKAEEYLTNAIDLSPKAIYYGFQAYIKYDYFARKSFITSPTYREALSQALQCSYSEQDSDELYTLLSVNCPEELKIK